MTRGSRTIVTATGAPWTLNFGAPLGTQERNDPRFGGESNVIMGVASASPRFDDPRVSSPNLSTFQKLQYSSLFGRNNAREFRNTPNIVELVERDCRRIRPPGARNAACADRINIPLTTEEAGPGRANLVHTTRGAWSLSVTPAHDLINTPSPTQFSPWRAAGKLLVTLRDGTVRQRSAALIGPGLLVTAAEALEPFGGASRRQRVVSIEFQPAPFNAALPYGSWTARLRDFAVAPAWASGTDRCDFSYLFNLGVRSCDSNYALIALRPNAEGRLPGPTTGLFALPPTWGCTRAAYYSFTPDFFLGAPRAAGAHAGQITILGYPPSGGGQRMVRTDAIASNRRFNTETSVVLSRYEMGFSQIREAIGAGWIVNFGGSFTNDTLVDPVAGAPFPVAPGFDAQPNTLVGVTGWVSDPTSGLNVQGSSALGATFFDFLASFCSGLEARCQAVWDRYQHFVEPRVGIDV